jgi:hypothetical protein
VAGMDPAARWLYVAFLVLLVAAGIGVFFVI